MQASDPNDRDPHAPKGTDTPTIRPGDQAPKWWERSPPSTPSPLKPRAVAYYRHSAEIGQENSVEIQQEHVRAFANTHGIEIVEEFADRGKSGLNAEGRPAFNELMAKSKKRTDFEYILVLDVSRWGRFQDTDLSAYYKALCANEGKKVVYTDLGLPKDGDLSHSLLESIGRYQAAEYSRNLSKKVFAGCKKVAEQGYRPGGPPPYALSRLMLDEQKQPDRILQPGQRKAIQNGRVVLVPGNPDHIGIVQEIFMFFVERKLDERQIAGVLNQRDILSPGGRQWSAASIRNVLINQQYAGAVVYNKTTQRLKTRTRPNPRVEWVVTPEAYDEIISPELFREAQAIFEQRKHVLTSEELLARMRRLYDRYALITARLLRFDPETPSPSTYIKHFGSLNGAFQQLHAAALDSVRGRVTEEILRVGPTVEPYEDFLVVNRSFTVLVQPSVPVPNGYESCWVFEPDRRPAVDITLGVPVDDDKGSGILGYLALPRLMTPHRQVRLAYSSDVCVELQGYSGLDLIRDLLV
jgi:DNA invertase Pin-like site-specific DNA recombinase